MTDALFATLAAHVVLAVVLGVRVIQLRLRHGVGIGDGDQRPLRRAIRVHANFVEWVPLALLCVAAAELRGASEVWIWGLGAALLISRLGHAVGLQRSIGTSVGRSGGMMLMFTVMLVALGLAAVGG